MLTGGETVFVTGASSGIGKATVLRFARAGFNVAATMRNVQSAPIEFQPFEHVAALQMDVRDTASIASAVNAAVARFGKIHVLVNNAGFGQYGLFEAVSPEKIREQFAVNVFGVMDVTRALLPHFRANGAGTVINVSSGAGIFTLPMISIYCASKFALEGFSEAISYELASQNIAVKIVEPHGGVTGTGFNERTTQDYAADASLKDYDDFAARTQAAFGDMVAARATTAADVAEMIHTAATDGSNKLRYLIGDDARGFIKAKHEMNDEHYVAFMRAKFGLKG